MAKGAELPQTAEQDRYPMSVTRAGAAGIQEGGRWRLIAGVMAAGA